MDWIDPKYARSLEDLPQPSGKARGKRLGAQLSAALAQPLNVWSQAFDHAVSQLRWPTGCTPEGTFLWSALVEEQAEVLVRAGMSAQKLAVIVAGATEGSARSEQLADVVGLMDQPLETMAFHWLDTADVYPHSALALAALLWHLPEHAKRNGNEWITQWLASCLPRIENYSAESEESVLCHLVMQAELPLLIAIGTATPKRTLLSEASLAMDALAEHLEASEDDPSSWLADGATFLRASLASILRCRVLADSLGLRKWYPPQQKALAELLRHAARWSRPDGTQLLSARSLAPKSKAMWVALTKQTKNPKSLSSAMTLSGIGQGKRTEVRTTVSPATLPAFTHYSDAASCCSMQSDWRHKGCRVAFDFSEPEICLEALGPKGESILGGYWQTQVEVDGQAQLQLDNWEELCWFSDDDIDYLELEAKFGQQAKIQRQIALFREERMLFLADALFVEDSASLRLKSRLPLTEGVQCALASKSTEGFLKSGSAKCLTMPLFLPEWRRKLSQANSRDAMTEVEQGVELTVENEGKALYAPVLLSLCNSHAKQAFTWRQLTVAQDLRIVNKDEAQAFRVQVGVDQLLIYRNLAKPVRRTTLGMHTLSDFYAGRFDSDTGELDEIIEVEPVV